MCKVGRITVLGAGAVLMLLIHSADSAILFPEEVPTLTGLAYSLLPPIKLGQDSRFGFGFRLGRNADAQVLVELGPQTNTMTLGENPGKRQSNAPQQSSDRQRREQIWRNIMKRMEKAVNDSVDKNR